jgi:hypothetical protein
MGVQSLGSGIHPRNLVRKLQLARVHRDRRLRRAQQQNHNGNQEQSLDD